MQVVAKSAIVGLASRRMGESIQKGVDSRNADTRKARTATPRAVSRGSWVRRRSPLSKDAWPSRKCRIGSNSQRASSQLTPSSSTTPIPPVRHRLNHDPATAVNITVIARSRRKIDVAIRR